MNDQATIEFDPGVQHPEDTGVPEDRVIDLPFPLLIATTGVHGIVAKVHQNQFFTLSIVELQPKNPADSGRPLKSANIRFGATPVNVEVGKYWRTAIETSAQAFYQMFLAELHQKLAVPEKPSLAVIQGGVVQG